MSKKVKQRPAIQANNVYIRRDEHVKCQTNGCRNVVATWIGHKRCTPCREAKR